jgi:hypothetical protein
MKILKALAIPALLILLVGAVRAGDQPTPATLPAGENMYVIERVIPAAGKKTPDELKAISQKSCSVLKQMGSQIQWVQSYVTGDKIYCIYIAPNEEMVREHAKLGGFPANSVSKVTTIISPKTAE